jgi:hypothetical protein
VPQVVSVGELLTVQIMNVNKDAAMAMSPATIQYLELLSNFMAAPTRASKPLSNYLKTDLGDSIGLM